MNDLEAGVLRSVCVAEAPAYVVHDQGFGEPVGVGLEVPTAAIREIKWNRQGWRGGLRGAGRPGNEPAGWVAVVKISPNPVAS